MFRFQATVSFLKKIHSGERFRKVALSVIVFIVCVWMTAGSGTKKLRLKTHTCGRGLKLWWKPRLNFSPKFWQGYHWEPLAILINYGDSDEETTKQLVYTIFPCGNAPGLPPGQSPLRKKMQSEKQNFWVFRVRNSFSTTRATFSPWSP